MGFVSFFAGLFQIKASVMKISSSAIPGPMFKKLDLTYAQDKNKFLYLFIIHWASQLHNCNNTSTLKKKNEKGNMVEEKLLSQAFH